MLRLLPLLSILFFTTHCTHTSTVRMAKSIENDTEYKEVVMQRHRQESIRKLFETKTTLHITKLDQKFLAAYLKRLKNLFHTESSPFIRDIKKYNAYFVSAYCAVYSQCNLSNQNLWTILKRNPDQKPIIIRKTNNKERWAAFFPGVSSWTSEYLIAFERSSTADQNLALEDSTTEVIFANAYANISFEWR